MAIIHRKQQQTANPIAYVIATLNTTKSTSKAKNKTDNLQNIIKEAYLYSIE